MTVISDTTPLHYLVQIGHVDVLPLLCGTAFTTPTVLEELRNPAAPEVVRAWADAPPTWLTVRRPDRALAFERVLHAGEAEAIALADTLRPARLLTDDRAGWLEAERLGLRPLRTLPLLWLVGERGLIDLAQALDRLVTTNFRVTPALLDRYRAQDDTFRKALRDAAGELLPGTGRVRS